MPMNKTCPLTRSEGMPVTHRGNIRRRRDRISRRLSSRARRGIGRLASISSKRGITRHGRDDLGAWTRRTRERILEGPQTYHGYAYVTNNPLVNIDPDGLAQTCSNDCTGSAPSTPDSSVLFGYSRKTCECGYFGAKDWSMLARLLHWVSKPRDPGCLGTRMAAGAGGGAVVGLVTGPGDVVTVPVGAAVGSITFSTAELLSGMLGCTANGISNFAGNAVGGGGGYKKPKSGLSGKEGA